MPAVFDIDGTLIKLEPRFDVCFTRAIVEVLGHEEFSQDWVRYPNVTDSGIGPHIYRLLHGRAATPQECKAIADFYIADLERDGGPGEPIPGVQAFLQLVRDSGRVIAIATGNCERSARWKLRAAGLDIDGIPMATSDDSVERFEIIAAAADLAGGGSDPVYFGDAVHDQRAAAKAGVRFIRVGMGVGCDLPDYTDTERALRLLNPSSSGSNSSRPSGP